MPLDLTKLLARFIEEAREHVEKLNGGLLALERTPEDPEIVNAVFRSAHTIKGSARMMKLTAISDVAHKMEDALGALREKKIRHSKALSDLLFRGVDVIGGMIETVAAKGGITEDTTALCAALANAAEGDVPSPGPPETAVEAPPAPAPEPAAVVETVGESPAVPQAKTKDVAHRVSDTIRVRSDKLDDVIRLMGEIVSSQNRFKPRLLAIRDVERTAKLLLERLSADGLRAPEVDGSGNVVDVARGLSLAIQQLASAMKDDATSQEALTGELQEKTLLMRMVPLSIVFDPLHRIARDIASAQGKDVELVIEGDDIALDKKMIDMVGDPLIHMLRNAIDHGIEPPEDRRAAGKPPAGRIRISAAYDAGAVVIEFSDDGAGISVQKIREKALRKRMFTADELRAMPESSLIELIYQPGFSTSGIITDVSGRGVGMDVVRKNIVEDLRGTVVVRTREGQETSFVVRLPMTLAIMRTLLVHVSQAVSAISSQYVREILRVERSEIISVVDKKAIRLREALIPVVDLGALLGLPAAGDRTDERPLLIVVGIGNDNVALIVDRLVDEEDMVIKSLPSHLRSIQMVSGVSLTGANEIVSVLHVPAILHAAREARGSRPAVEVSRRTILVVDDSVNTREIERSILEAHGYRVEVAGDGIEALERAHRVRYDLVVTDVEMPRMDGFSLTERLRGEQDYKDTPIVIVTSREKEEDKRRGIQVGADAYIGKGSFDQSHLLETVQNLIGA